MQKPTFKILGMDCAEEVAVLKREVGPIVGGEDRLLFDVINGKMTVAEVEASDRLTDEIQTAVAATGMKAIDWQEHLEEAEAGLGFWALRGRSIMCALSGIFLAGGFSWHAVSARSVVAALGGAEEFALPAVAILLYSFAVITGAWFVLPKAWFALRRLAPDMNLLMVVAILGAISIAEWFEAGAVAFLFALALLLESWSVGRARRAIKSLVDLSPATARYRSPTDGDVLEKRVEEIPVGSEVIVRPGEKVPLDGVVAKGDPAVNEAPITGESMPAEKTVGDEVYAGTINGDTPFEFKTTRRAEDTTLARVIRMVEEAQSRRAPSEQWVERFARVYTPSMMLLAASIAVFPPMLFGGDWGRWFYEALVILVIACPCALVISTPVCIVAGLASAARAGVLIKGGAYLEAPARLRAIAFDKTGTLSFGRPEVQDIIPLNGHTRSELLARAAALEAENTHPLARAVLAAAEAEAVEIVPADDYRIIPGKGASGHFDGRKFWVGSHRFVHDMEAEDEAFCEIADKMEDAGHSLVVIGNEKHICGLIAVADGLRPEAAAALRSIKALGIEATVMLTGDNERAARGVAASAGIDEFRAELLPEDKVRAVHELHDRYGSIAMVGDGVNDAPAMAASTVGIAMGAVGSDAAIETADIALMSDDLGKIPWLIAHSRRTLSIIKQNVAFALGLKLAFIVMAFAGVATLWMAIAADMGASLLVIFNSLRLLGAARSEPPPT